MLPSLKIFLESPSFARYIGSRKTGFLQIQVKKRDFGQLLHQKVEYKRGSKCPATHRLYRVYTVG